MTKEEFCKELKESQERGILFVCSTAQKYVNSLEAENKRLTKKLAFEKRQAENWRDRAEKLEHEKHPEHFESADHLSHDSEMVIQNLKTIT